MVRAEDSARAVTDRPCVGGPVGRLIQLPDGVYRSLSTARPFRVPTLPNDPDAQQHALIGWTKAQVLAQYGSPNEPGSLRSLLKLKAWTYVAAAYSMVWFNFGTDGRVSRAVVSRSP